ncbi:MAG: DUF6206 family protein [Microscillaceae bacterium]|nr:DUF6206 family protein [Microscillaceae bacterium]
MPHDTYLIDYKAIDKLILSGEYKKQAISKLGFFSSPIKIHNQQGDALVLKIYKPIKNPTLMDFILENHKDYILKMRALGILIPDTEAQVRQIASKFYLIICQKAFEPSELVRNLLEEAPKNRFLEIMTRIFDDILLYWQNKKNEPLEIGFHPTLRNYALRDEKLYYFDTFPPMLMPQKHLNKIILKMAPLQIPMQYFVPQHSINRVSDEYYQLDKMIIGVIGSCCRLRPEFHAAILESARAYIAQNDQTDPSDKNKILCHTEKAPKLSKIWVFCRRLFGNVGKPNIHSKV